MTNRNYMHGIVNWILIVLSTNCDQSPSSARYSMDLLLRASLCDPLDERVAGIRNLETSELLRERRESRKHGIAISRIRFRKNCGYCV